MSNNDRKITAHDLHQLAADIRTHVWHDGLKDLLAAEPALAECMAMTWHRIDMMLTEFGLTTKQIEDVRQQMVLFVGKPLVVLDRAHRRMWNDLLPGDLHGGNDV